MMEITAEIRALIDKAAAGVELAGDEYIDPADGLIHCKKCGGQRQTVVPCFGKSGYFMPRCICQCQREAEEQRKTAEERQRRMERIKRRKAQGLQDRYLYDYTFSNDNGQNPLMDKAHAYVENWKEAYKSNIGRPSAGSMYFCYLEMWEPASLFSPDVLPMLCLTGMCRC